MSQRNRFFNVAANVFLMSERRSTLMSQKGGMLMSKKLNTLLYVTQK